MSRSCFDADAGRAKTFLIGVVCVLVCACQAEAVQLPWTINGNLGTFSGFGLGNVVFNTDDGTYVIGGTTFSGGEVLTMGENLLGGGASLETMVFDFSSFELFPGSTITAVGSRPLTLMSLGSMLIDSTIDVSGGGGGGGAYGPVNAGGAGGGGGGGGGAVALLANGSLEILPSGRIRATGGGGGAGGGAGTIAVSGTGVGGLGGLAVASGGLGADGGLACLTPAGGSGGGGGAGSGRGAGGGGGGGGAAYGTAGYGGKGGRSAGNGYSGSMGGSNSGGAGGLGGTDTDGSGGNGGAGGALWGGSGSQGSGASGTNSGGGGGGGGGGNLLNLGGAGGTGGAGSGGGGKGASGGAGGGILPFGSIYVEPGMGGPGGVGNGGGVVLGSAYSTVTIFGTIDVTAPEADPVYGGGIYVFSVNFSTQGPGTLLGNVFVDPNGQYSTDFLFTGGGGGGGGGAAGPIIPEPGDANGDGVVNDTDASIVGAHWMSTDAQWGDGDFNGDNVVNDRDAAILAAHWHEAVEQNPSVPEPSMLVSILSLLATGALGFVWHRRRKPA
jgi:hypothetical protein